MRSREPRRSTIRATAWMMILLLAGCATTEISVPERSLQSPHGTASGPYGGWIEVKSADGILTGELIAVTPDTLYLADTIFTAVPAASIRTARLITYRADNMGGVVALGTISTLANGWYLIFTAPMWLIAGSIAAVQRSYEPLIDYPDEPLKKFAPFARHPAGLPPGLDRNAATRKYSRRSP